MAIYMVFMSTTTTLTRRETVHGLLCRHPAPNIRNPVSSIQHPDI